MRGWVLIHSSISHMDSGESHISRWNWNRTDTKFGIRRKADTAHRAASQGGTYLRSYSINIPLGILMASVQLLSGWLSFLLTLSANITQHARCISSYFDSVNSRIASEGKSCSTHQHYISHPVIWPPEYPNFRWHHILLNIITPPKPLEKPQQDTRHRGGPRMKAQEARRWSCLSNQTPETGRESTSCREQRGMASTDRRHYLIMFTHTGVVSHDISSASQSH